jgi:SAM-dependent methyltransferase
MASESRQVHWENVYRTKPEEGVSWFQEDPATSLALIRALGTTARSAIVDIGGGASRLVDRLVGEGFADVAVLDLSAAALDKAKARLGAASAQVNWVIADVTAWQPARTYDIWHDRAAFHFLVREEDRSAYIACLRRALKTGGHAIVATFALDGPERCSGLPVMRYDPPDLAHMLAPSFTLVDSRRDAHRTPAGATQSFQFSVFRRSA